MDTSASEVLQHLKQLSPSVEALRKGSEKLRNYICEAESSTFRFCQPAANFFRACRVFDVTKLNILNVTYEFICENIPWFDDNIQAKTEVRIYLSSVGDLRATPYLVDF